MPRARRAPRSPAKSARQATPRASLCRHLRRASAPRRRAARCAAHWSHQDSSSRRCAGREAAGPGSRRWRMRRSRGNTPRAPSARSASRRFYRIGAVMDAIVIRDLRVEALIGIHRRERHVLQTVSIDLEIGLPGEQVFASDKVADTIAALLVKDFGAPWVKVSAAKIGILANAKFVGVTIERRKS